MPTRAALTSVTPARADGLKAFLAHPGPGDLRTRDVFANGAVAGICRSPGSALGDRFADGGHDFV
jgi:hypothetical protein